MARPSKADKDKVSFPMRFLITSKVLGIVNDLMLRLDLNPSDFARLAIYNIINEKGLNSEEFINDPTFRNLKEKGLI